MLDLPRNRKTEPPPPKKKKKKKKKVLSPLTSPLLPTPTPLIPLTGEREGGGERREKERERE